MLRGFHSYHPLPLFLYYIAVLTGIMLQQHPIFQVTGLLCIILTNLILDKGTELNKWKYMILFISIFALLFTPIFNRQGTAVLFTVLSFEVHIEAVAQGIMIAFTLAGILVLFASFNLVITTDKFLYLFSKWFPKWTFILILTLRFTTLFRKRLKDIQNVQETKGVSMKDGDLRTKAKHGMLFIQILLTYSLEEAIQTADSMSARGYGLQKRSNYQSYIWKKRDSRLLGLIIILSFLMVYGWYLNISILMVTPTIQPIRFDGPFAMNLIGWVSLVSLPIWSEGKEVLRWNYLKQKI